MGTALRVRDQNPQEKNGVQRTEPAKNGSSRHARRARRLATRRKRSVTVATDDHAGEFVEILRETPPATHDVSEASSPPSTTVDGEPTSAAMAAPMLIPPGTYLSHCSSSIEGTVDGWRELVEVSGELLSDQSHFLDVISAVVTRQARWSEVQSPVSAIRDRAWFITVGDTPVISAGADRREVGRVDTTPSANTSVDENLPVHVVDALLPSEVSERVNLLFDPRAPILASFEATGSQVDLTDSSPCPFANRRAVHNHGFYVTSQLYDNIIVVGLAGWMMTGLLLILVAFRFA